MAHMIQETDQIAYVRDTPWHGLGIKVEPDLTPAQIQTVAGLDWTVSKRPLAFISSPEDAKVDDVSVSFTKSIEVKERYALVRDSDDQFLDIVGKTYRPTQNKDAFEFFDAFVKETKLKMHTAGSLCSGKYVWALAETEKAFEIGPAKDRVESYVLLVSPHQFGKCLVVQQTTVRVVCQNTLNLALSEAGAASYRMPHSREFNAEAKLQAAKVMGLINESFLNFENEVEVLAASKIKRIDVVDFYSELLKIDHSTMLAANDDGLPKSRNLRQFMDAYEGASPGSDLSGTKNTLWGVVNAVTYVMDHASVRNKELAFRDNLFGYRGDLKRKALNLALQKAA